MGIDDVSGAANALLGHQNNIVVPHHKKVHAIARLLSMMSNFSGANDGQFLRFNDGRVLIDTASALTAGFAAFSNNCQAELETRAERSDERAAAAEGCSEADALSALSSEAFCRQRQGFSGFCSQRQGNRSSVAEGGDITGKAQADAALEEGGPELWDISGTHVDLTASYTAGGTMWELQKQAIDAIDAGGPIRGASMIVETACSGCDSLYVHCSHVLKP